MSFFGRKTDAPVPPPSFEQAVPEQMQPINQGGNGSRSAAVMMATNELKGMTNLFNSLSNACFNKCIQKFNTADLAVGELACDDRCAIKYMETQTLIAESLKKANEAQQAAQMAQMQQQ